MFTLVDELLPIHSTSVLSKTQRWEDERGSWVFLWSLPDPLPTVLHPALHPSCWPGGTAATHLLCYFPLSLSREMQGQGIRKVRACISHTPYLCIPQTGCVLYYREKTPDNFQSIDQSINQPVCLSLPFPFSFRSSLPCSLFLLLLSVSYCNGLTHLTFQVKRWYDIWFSCSQSMPTPIAFSMLIHKCLDIYEVSLY